MKLEDKFIATLMDDIAKGRLELPTLPEVAMKVRKMAEDPSVSGDKLAKIISTDAALSARLVQVANSVFFRGLTPVEDVRTAVIRLGGICVRNVVSSLVMSQIYQAKEVKAIKKDLHTLWIHGARVAAISNVLAKRLTKLNADEAMLAGLIHDIGTLPILKRALDFPDILEDRAALQRVIDYMHTDIGKMIIEDWHFPKELVTAVAEHENFERDENPEPDYADIVLLANLHSYMGTTNNRYANVDWTSLPALKKLGLTPEQSIATMAEAQAEIAEIQKLLAA
ncbi:HDOD domain-containing protein [Pseudomonadota bacterium]